MGNALHKGKKVEVVDTPKVESINVETCRNNKLSTIYERHEENNSDVLENHPKKLTLKDPALPENTEEKVSIVIEQEEDIQEDSEEDLKYESAPNKDSVSFDKATDNDNICES